MDLLWFLPTHGDGRYLGSAIGGRTVTHDYIAQVARAADTLGYFGVLLPTGRSCEDSWVVASSMIPLTKQLRFLVAVRPGLQSPAVAARMAATLDRMSNGRLLINVVTGGDPVELKGDGLFLDHDERYVLTDEFLQVWRRMMQGENVDFAGKHIRVEGARLLFPPLQTPYPPLYFGGSSDAGQAVAAEQCDLYLSWGEPPHEVAEKIEAVKAKAAALGRTMRFGLRVHIIVRETEEQAWRDADDLIRYVDDAVIAKAQSAFARMDSVGQKRMVRLHGGGAKHGLVIAPNLWAGVGLVRGGAGTALVGSPEQVVERLREYAAIGVDSVIMSGYPHLEEAYRVAELVFPLLDGGPRKASENAYFSPFGEGEAIANESLPERRASQS